MPAISTFGEIYRDFEDAFRGAPELIAGRQRVYLKLLGDIPQSIRTRQAVDIGAGRGEWLRELRQHGWQDLLGVEPDLAMARDIRDAGIPLRAEDGLTCLKALPDESAAIVTAFHVVEHVEIDYLVAMLSEMARVLAPGGILILETPNPESIRVATWSFPIDPTHRAPIAPPLLHFLVARVGLPDCAIVRLNGVLPDPSAPASRRITDQLFNSGLDYAVVAQKPSGVDGAISRVTAFAQEVGQPSPADYGHLAAQFAEFETGYPILAARITERDEAIGAQVSDLASRGTALASRIDEHGRGVERLHAEIGALADRIGRLEANLAIRLGQPQSRGAALRTIGVGLAARPGRLARRIYRPVMLSGIRFVTARPALRRQAERALSWVPGLEAYLRRFATAPPAASSDPNAPYLFRPGEAPVGEQGPVTVEHLYHLSRSL